MGKILSGHYAIADRLRGLVFSILVLACLVAVFLPDGAVHAAPPSNSLWQSVLDESFQGASLNTKLWNTCYLWGNSCTNHGGNGELERYSPNNISVQNGALQLVAQSQNASGFYPSGMINSQNRFAFQYGYIESSMKIPSGQGLWPAFWLLPQDDSQSIEIDIMEVIGQQPAIDYQVDHYNYGSGRHFIDYLASDDLSKAYHTYGLLWEPDKLVWYLDGIPTFTVIDPSAIPNKPMYPILNLAVGGSWPGYPNSSTPFPATLSVQYIRVWKYLGPAPIATLPPPATPTIQAMKTVIVPSSANPPAKNLPDPKDAAKASHYHVLPSAFRLIMTAFACFLIGALALAGSYYYFIIRRPAS